MSEVLSSTHSRMYASCPAHPSSPDPLSLPGRGNRANSLPSERERHEVRVGVCSHALFGWTAFSRVGLPPARARNRADAVLVGASLKRKEDARLVAGRGRYLDDLTLPGLLHLGLVRSVARARPHRRRRWRGGPSGRRRGGVDARRSARAGRGIDPAARARAVDPVVSPPGARRRPGAPCRRSGRGGGGRRSRISWPTRSSASASSTSRCPRRSRSRRRARRRRRASTTRGRTMSRR